ncbi:hypothetical protein [Burkholderia pseudomallei]|uniref:hypothetical protein n=1 Tax=Burkholderia pseudomallei TaxID=28450 RepID=UPI001C12C063|nr:hypothetical protein [Burkholderia pseudomallei]
MRETKDADRPISTNELAALLSVTAQSIYKRLCIAGSYWGIHPTKMPNKRLLWPANAIALIKQAQEGTTEQAKESAPAEQPAIPPLYGDKVHITGVVFCTPQPPEVKQ